MHRVQKAAGGSNQEASLGGSAEQGNQSEHGKMKLDKAEANWWKSSNLSANPFQAPHATKMWSTLKPERNDYFSGESQKNRVQCT